MTSAGNSRMSCGVVQELLSAFHDGELPADVRPSVVEHLDECAECAGVLQQFRAISEAASKLPDPTVRSVPWESLEQGLSDSEVVVPRGRWDRDAPRRRWGARKIVAAGLAALVLGVIGYLDGHNSSLTITLLLK